MSGQGNIAKRVNSGLVKIVRRNASLVSNINLVKKSDQQKG